MPRIEPKKRQLKFNNFDELLAEVHSLQEKTYTSNGNWSLGQSCGHLADWMRFPMDGFPTPPIFMRPIFWVMKYTVGPGLKKKILADGFKGGMPTAPETVPKPTELTDEQGVEKLQGVIDRISSFDGELHPSPLFGPMDRDTWLKVNLLHAEHHFGYLEPQA